MMDIDLLKLQKVIYVLAFFTSLIILLLFLSIDTKSNRKFIKLGNNIFNRLSRLPILKSRLFNLRARIYNNTFGEDLFIRYRVIIYLILSWIGGLMVATIVISFFSNNTYVTCTLLFLCYQVKEIILDSLIGKDTPFLESLEDYGVELQQAFNLTHDVRTGIEEANNNSNNYNLVKRMEEAAKLLDEPEELDSYMIDCPNDYLKLMILNCSLVAEHGDKKDANGKSVFIENIYYNNENIETEVFKRKQLEFWLRGLKMMCILPFLSFSPFETWAATYLPVTDSFYKSSKGFLLKLAITIIGVIFFYLIAGFEKSHRIKSKEQKEEYWEDKILRINIIKNLIIKITPKVKSQNYYRFRKLISNSGEFITIERIFVQKFVFSIIGFIAILSVMFSIHQINKSSILNNLVKSEYLSVDVVVTANGQENVADVEKDLFNDVDKNDIDTSFNKITEKLEDKGIESSGTSSIVRDIITKKINYDNENMNIIDFLISLIGIIIGFYVPDMILQVKAKYRKQEMENEIIIFETIILIFMYHEHGTSEVILEHMLKFSDIFRPQVETILKDLNKSDYEALKVLEEEIKFKPFLNIVKNLIKADNIKTSEAFLSLSENRRNYLMNRKEDNKRTVHKRVSLASDISLIPLGLIMTFYIAYPIYSISSSQYDKTTSEIMEIQSN